MTTFNVGKGVRKGYCLSHSTLSYYLSVSVLRRSLKEESISCPAS